MYIAKKNDFMCGIVLIVVSAYFYYESYFFREVAYFSIGPTVFPRTILGLIMILSALLCCRSVMLGRRVAGCGHERKKDRSKEFILQLSFFALVVAYVVGLHMIGYLASTFLFLFLGILLLGNRTLKAAGIYGAIAVGVTGGLYYLFGTVMKLFLP